MAEVTAGNEERFDSLLRRLNKKLQQDGTLCELRRREYFEKPSIRRKRKKTAKRRSAAGVAGK